MFLLVSLMKDVTTDEKNSLSSSVKLSISVKLRCEEVDWLVLHVFLLSVVLIVFRLFIDFKRSFLENGFGRNVTLDRLPVSSITCWFAAADNKMTGTATFLRISLIKSIPFVPGIL